MSHNTAAATTTLGLKLMLLSTLAFSQWANAQVIECRSIKAFYIDPLGKSHIGDCRKDDKYCKDLRIDLKDCDKTESEYRCTKILDSDHLLEKKTITINRLNATASKVWKSTTKKENNFFGEGRDDYDQCKLANTTPQF